MGNDNFEPRPGRNRWMWWLFIVVGLFIVCLLIWMFTAMSSDEVKEQEAESAEYAIPAAPEDTPQTELPAEQTENPSAE